MKTLRFSILLFVSIIVSNNFQAQLIGGKKKSGDVEVDAKAAFDAGIQEARIASRARLNPYKYDGTKSTTFNYKTYTHAKEVEVLTIEDTDYKLCFDGKMITADNIKVEIYDKPIGSNGRILLFEKDGVGPGEFQTTLEEMNATFVAAKLATIKEPEKNAEKVKLYKTMRLKKVYINYIIPAVDREVVLKTEDGNQDQTTTIQFSSIVVAIGHKFM